MKGYIFLILATFSVHAFSSDIDQQLKKLIKDNNLQALEPSFKEDIHVIRLGQRLFSERELSGNRDI
ncbi:hypothetical protein, partial [Bacteriovorax sp. DB6_IX]